MSEKEASRRNVLYGLAAAGVAVPVLAACGSANDPATSSAPDPSTPSTPSTPDSSSPSAPGSSAPPAGSIPTSSIPVGGGKIFPDDKLVVTQPKKGEFKAFSAVCKHQGCIVNEIKSGTIDCPCHGSMYSISDGSVKGGPAPAPLDAKKVTVSGDSLIVS